jgi:hypothetical protein
MTQPAPNWFNTYFGTAKLLLFSSDSSQFNLNGMPEGIRFSQEEEKRGRLGLCQEYSPPIPVNTPAASITLKQPHSADLGYFTSQVWTVVAEFHNKEGSRTTDAIAKIYDPLYYTGNQSIKSNVNPFPVVNDAVHQEYTSYQTLASFQGGLLPQFYGLLHAR